MAPEVGIRAAEATVYFFAGLFGGARWLAQEDIEEADAPDESSEHGWLKAAFIFGVTSTAERDVFQPAALSSSRR